jgi:hypothetical protein
MMLKLKQVFQISLVFTLVGLNIALDALGWRPAKSNDTSAPLRIQKNISHIPLGDIALGTRRFDDAITSYRRAIIETQDARRAPQVKHKGLF